MFSQMPPPPPKSSSSVDDDDDDDDSFGMMPPPVRLPTAMRKHSNPSSPNEHGLVQAKRVKLEPLESQSDDRADRIPSCVAAAAAAAAAASPSTACETHIIFAIDFSGSMKTADVEKATAKGTKKITRWKAVFECVNDLLAEQIQHNDNNPDTDAGTCVVSLLIFNLHAQTLLKRCPLVGNGKTVFDCIKDAQKMKPHLGTCFSAGMREAEQLASLSTTDNVMLVFLTDGRPGDLKPTPPKFAEQMQNSYNHCKQRYPSAGVHLERMQMNHADRFKLQLICLFNAGKPWMEYLSHRYGGELHTPALSMGGVPGSTPIDVGFDENDNIDEEDEIIEMKVKSQESVLRGRFNRAVASGHFHSIHSTAPSSTMRSTFQSISSTVSSIRNQLPERQVVLEAPERPSPMIKYEATRMFLDNAHEKFVVASGEKSNERLVKISLRPFAQGGLRNVFRMEEILKKGKFKALVAKESRHQVKYQDRLRFHIETSSCHARGSVYAAAFNKRWKKAKKENPQLSELGVSRINFLNADVYRLKDLNQPGGFRYLAVEEVISTGAYKKWNSNNGYVHEESGQSSIHFLVAQAFSHFSYEHSHGREMVVDIQGSAFTYTDPQLHSKEKDYGRADRGESGFTDFFKTHKCSCVCKGLGLAEKVFN